MLQKQKVMKMIIKEDNESKKNTSLYYYEKAAKAITEELNVIIQERNYIRKTLSNEMDYLLEKYKDNEVTKREINLFNEIISRMIKIDKRGEEILDEYGIKGECTETN